MEGSKHGIRTESNIMADQQQPGIHNMHKGQSSLYEPISKGNRAVQMLKVGGSSKPLTHQMVTGATLFDIKQMKTGTCLNAFSFTPKITCKASPLYVLSPLNVALQWALFCIVYCNLDRGRGGAAG